MDAMLGSPMILQVMVTTLDITNRTCDLFPVTQFFELNMGYILSKTHLALGLVTICTAFQKHVKFVLEHHL